MPLKIRRDSDKTHQIRIKGTTLYYKHLGFVELTRLYRECMVNGVMPEDSEEETAIKFMQKMITGWKGAIDMDTGKEIIFKPEYIRGMESDGLLKFFNKVLLPDLDAHAMTVTSTKNEDELGN